jgi:predicted RNA binding protein YcfA (HicA-like mRNA interferase family)
MNWNEMRRLVISSGYEFVKHGKRHDIYRHKERKDILLIERHWSQEVRPNLMKKILSQIGA